MGATEQPGGVVAQQRSACTRALGMQVEEDYLLTAESDAGPTRLELTLRWAAPKQAEAAEAAGSTMDEAVQAQASGYKSLIESAGGRA